MANHSYLATAEKCLRLQSTITQTKIITYDTFDTYYQPFYSIKNNESFFKSDYDEKSEQDSVVQHCVIFCLILAAIHEEI
jgi:subtilase family serine protease